MSLGKEWEKDVQVQVGKERGKRKTKYCLGCSILPFTVLVPTVNPWALVHLWARLVISESQMPWGKTQLTALPASLRSTGQVMRGRGAAQEQRLLTSDFVQRRK